MNKKIFFLALLGIVASPAMAYAINSPTTMASNVADMAVTIGAAIVVIGWVVAGILYLTSAGSPEKTGTAKKALIACLIGTVLVIIAKLGYSGIQQFLNPIIGS